MVYNITLIRWHTTKNLHVKNRLIILIGGKSFVAHRDEFHFNKQQKKKWKKHIYYNNIDFLSKAETTTHLRPNLTSSENTRAEKPWLNWEKAELTCYPYDQFVQCSFRCKRCTQDEIWAFIKLNDDLLVTDWYEDGHGQGSFSFAAVTL